MANKNIPACAVILAGGRGTRFWPRSRKRTPKQLLNIVGGKSMLRETVNRLSPLFSNNRIWVVTNDEQAEAVHRALPHLPRVQILTEPFGRNTAAAIGLAAIHLAKDHGDALMAVLPADHHIANTASYHRILRSAMMLAGEPGNLAVLGIPPTRPDTGFGYIQRGEPAWRHAGIPAYAVKRFTEKPRLQAARKYVTSRRYFWNAGMFFWRVSTYLECLRQFLPQTFTVLRELEQTIGTRAYSASLKKSYAHVENISVDYAVMEPATRKRAHVRVFVLPAKIGWSDIGSWDAVYELLARRKDQNISNVGAFTLDASGNFIWSRDKFAAVIGTNKMIIVDTDDALLVCPRERAQDVGQVVKWLEQKRRKDLL